MPRFLITLCALLPACYASHGLPERGSDASIDARGSFSDATRTEPGERCFPSAVTTITVGAAAGCVRTELPSVSDGECTSFVGAQRGTAVRLLRTAVGRVDARVTCTDCAVHGVSPDRCDGCRALEPSSGHRVIPFSELQVDGLAEFIVTGGGTLEVCFDPDYGPPPWDE